VTDPAGLTQLYHDGGAATPIVDAVPGTYPLARVEDWWTIVLGTGYRATVEQLAPAAAQRVRQANLTWLRAYEVPELHMNVVYARARKDPFASRGDGRASPSWAGR
jgi:hypothetical protein